MKNYNENYDGSYYANYNKNILPIIPENFKTVGHNSMAMNKITVDQVLDEVKKFI